MYCIFRLREIQLFLERYKEGYDGKDERYQIWLKMYYPGMENIDDFSLNGSVFHTPNQGSKVQKCTQIVAVSKPSSKIDRLFSKPELPTKLPIKAWMSSYQFGGIAGFARERRKKDAAKQKRELRQMRKVQK